MAGNHCYEEGGEEQESEWPFAPIGDEHESAKSNPRENDHAHALVSSENIVLLCSEIFSQPRSKTQRAKVPQPARRVPVAEETRDIPAAETGILAASEGLGREAARATPPPLGAQIPITVP